MAAFDKVAAQYFDKNGIGHDRMLRVSIVESSTSALRRPSPDGAVKHVVDPQPAVLVDQNKPIRPIGIGRIGKDVFDLDGLPAVGLGRIFRHGRPALRPDRTGTERRRRAAASRRAVAAAIASFFFTASSIAAPSARVTRYMRPKSPPSRPDLPTTQNRSPSCLASAAVSARAGAGAGSDHRHKQRSKQSGHFPSSDLLSAPATGRRQRSRHRRSACGR